MYVKSYSPTINQDIYNIVQSVDHNELNHSDIKNKKKIEKILLKLLKYNNINDINKLEPPKQLYSNCWFNTMFVNFFFSDKGRKFFKYFRFLMITGKRIENKKLININEQDNLNYIFYILNLYIQRTFNQSYNNFYTKKNNAKKHKKSYKQKKNVLNIDKYLDKIYLKYNINKKNTNYFIKNIYDILVEKNNNIINVKQAGNPIEYYKNIINYLDNTNIYLNELNITNNIDISNYLEQKFQRNFPHLILINDFQSRSKYDIMYNINNIKYKLDSIIITNKDHFNKNSNSHFVSVLTINNKEYKFDGSSLKKLSSFKWKNKINKNIDWGFIEDPIYVPHKYNFTKGYKILFYYRIN